MMSLDRSQRLLKRFFAKFRSYQELKDATTLEATIAYGRKFQLDGFNGNILRAKLLSSIFKIMKGDVFVETGTSHAATSIAAYKILNSKVYTCENSIIEYLISRLLTLEIRSISLFFKDSVDFLTSIETDLIKSNATPLFYLDAHEGRLDKDSLPLEDELSIILKYTKFACIIDDFKIPMNNTFNWGSYGGKDLEIDLISSFLKQAGIYSCYFPNYNSSDDTGYNGGFCLFWRSDELDYAYSKNEFPFNLIDKYSLNNQ